jgi:hypothetical protein
MAGEMHKVNFAEISGDPKVEAQVVARRNQQHLFLPEVTRGYKCR